MPLTFTIIYHIKSFSGRPCRTWSKACVGYIEWTVLLVITLCFHCGERPRAVLIPPSSVTTLPGPPTSCFYMLVLKKSRGNVNISIDTSDCSFCATKYINRSQFWNKMYTQQKFLVINCVYLQGIFKRFNCG